MLAGQRTTDSQLKNFIIERGKLIIKENSEKYRVLT
jgi:hypothetical protein